MDRWYARSLYEMAQGKGLETMAAPKFGKRSTENLNTCDERLQKIMQAVIDAGYDCSILEGYRGQYLQDKYFHEGKSKLKFPQGKHNTLPSLAVDVAPYPIDWKDTERFRLFAGIVIGIAAAQGVKLRWGGDWDGDLTNKDQSFHDLPHFEILED